MTEEEKRSYLGDLNTRELTAEEKSDIANPSKTVKSTNNYKENLSGDENPFEEGTLFHLMHEEGMTGVDWEEEGHVTPVKN